MFARSYQFIMAGCLLMLPAYSIAQGVPDYEREQRLADEFVDGIVVGEVLSLNDGKRDFVAIMAEAEDEAAKGAVLLLHGRGYHPAWPAVIQPLRTTLPEQGWTTLSIQMPVLAKGAKYFDYVPLFAEASERIRVAIEYLRKTGYDNVVLLAHSCGVHMSIFYIDRHSDKAFDAYIVIGAGATDYKQPMVGSFPFAKMKTPILDIYGGDDYPAVLRKAPERKRMMAAAGHAKSLQTVIDGADHDYEQAAHVEQLTEKILAWLDTL